jgi:DNA helicase-2/ATP-dependent DNA helicase PcrA
MLERVSLTAEQELAVTSDERFVLVSAGAGTGKTFTLARRIAYLVEIKKVDPSLVWALTFTNRAAEEMRARIKGLASPAFQNIEVWIGTIHALGAELIRRYSSFTDNSSPFTIADIQYQTEMVRILKELWAPRFDDMDVHSFLSLLSRAKNDLPGDSWAPMELEFKELYQQYLTANNILDYDDLILRALEIIQCSELRKILKESFGHILVDEYQDINPLQYRLIRALVDLGGTLFAIGDADQCIYGFRGAYIGNFLNFSQDYPGAKTIPLTINYRCSKTILKAAQGVIKQNRNRIPVSLQARNSDGKPVTVVRLDNEKAEARFVVKEIERLLGGSHSLSVARTDVLDEDGQGDYHFSDFLVAYRTHAVAHEIRNEFYRAGLPVSEPSIDLLLDDEVAAAVCAYLRLLWKPEDDRAFFHAASARGGPGRKVLQNVLRIASKTGMPLWEAAEHAMGAEICGGRSSIESWCNSLKELKASLRDMELTSLMPLLLERFDLARHIASLDTHEPWRQVLNLSLSFQGTTACEAIPPFLDLLAMQNSSERIGPPAHAVTLLTLHAAKGLEFPVVFLVGAEDGIIPFRRGGQEPDIEEERRLFYVGMTRAKERLYVTHCKSRFMSGRRALQEPSPFIGEIGSEGLNFQTLGPPAKPRKSRQMSLW